MTKKRSASKTKASFTSMGRVLFYLVAITVACCGVAVVLFETDAGLELVASLRSGDKAGGAEAKTKPPVSTSEKKGSPEKHRTSESLPKQASAPDHNHERKPSAEDANKPKDTSSIIAEQSNEEQQNKEATKNERHKEPAESHEEERSERIVEETTEQNERTSATDGDDNEESEATGGAETTDSVGDPEFDSEKERELWESVDNQPGDNRGDQSNQVDEDEAQQTNNEADDHNMESDEDDEEDRETVEDRVDKEEGISEPGEEGEESEEYDMSVGDSWVDNEKETFEQQQETEREQYETVEEPEGPPIDEYPRHARRGLRGDYGGRGTKGYYYTPSFIHKNVSKFVCG